MTALHHPTQTPWGFSKYNSFQIPGFLKPGSDFISESFLVWVSHDLPEELLEEGLILKTLPLLLESVPPVVSVIGWLIFARGLFSQKPPLNEDGHT